jgi:hypothetical protein
MDARFRKNDSLKCEYTHIVAFCQYYYWLDCLEQSEMIYHRERDRHNIFIDLVLCI